MRVLVADDDRDNRDFLQALMQSQGHTVVQAANGLQALDLVRADPPDLIISDVLMPEMDGFLLCRVLKASEALRRIPLVFYTATYVNSGDGALGHALGAARYLLKPMEPRLFLDQINAVMAEAAQGKPPAGAQRVGDGLTIAHAYQERISEKLDKKSRDVNRLNRERALILDAVGEGILGLDPQGRCTSLNAAAATMLGRSADEIIGISAHMLWQSLAPDVGTLSKEQYPIYATLEKGEVHRNIEATWWRQNGTTMPVEYASSPLVEEGVIMGAVVVFRDISERKKAQKILSESESRLAAVIDSAMDAIVSVNSAYKVVVFNSAAEKMFGISAVDMLGQALDRLIPTQFRAGHSQHIRQYGSTVSTSRAMGALGQLSAIRASGEEFPIEASISQVAINGEKLFTVIVRDITQRKAAEQALLVSNADLARSNADLEQFAYVASHDLQEPLRSICSSVQLLQRRYTGALDARADEFISHTVGGAQRMQLIIDDLLAYSRVSAAPLALKVIDLSAALAVAQANLSDAIAASQAQIDHDELPHLVANPILMAQIFQNLVGNALKFRGDAPAHVQVKSHKVGAEWVISVADRGIGIEPQYFERIFKLFQRLHIRTDYPGTGIGLTICKKIVERHGGRMWVESCLGEGSTFFFTLPESAQVSQSTLVQSE